MLSSKSVKNLFTALLKAQRNMEPVKKTAVNPYFKSKYADFEAVVAVCKPALNEAGIVYSHWIGKDPVLGGYVELVLAHAESEEWIAEKSFFNDTPKDIQKMGSEITYLKRYTLQAATGMATEDDDGNSAVVGKSAETKTVTLNGVSHEIIEMTKTFNDEKFTSMVVSMISKAGTNVAELNIIRDKVRTKLAEKGALNGTR